jgi:hypothetical protein
MRARLLSLIILLAFLALPAWIYWFFFRSQIASLQVSVSGSIPYHVSLIGKLDTRSLPLADTLIHIERDCVWTCVFSPIAPIHYSLSLTSTGKVSLTDDIMLAISETKTLTYDLKWDISIEPAMITPLWNTDIGMAMLANAIKKDPDFNYTLVGVGWDTTVYAERTSTGVRELGILSLDRFAPLWKVPKWVGTILLDITGEYFIAPLFTHKTLILSRDTTRQYELPLTDVIGYTPWITDEKILTSSGIITSWHGSYGENPRFTDWLDISPTERLGYIAQDDIEKLTLSHFPAGESVLIVLDRQTNQSYVLKKWIDIRFLFSSQWVPVFLDHEGKLWKIEIDSN